MLFRAESLDTPDHGRSGESAFAQKLDDGFVERPTVPRVGLADVDPGEKSCSLELHAMPLPIARPTKTAISPSTHDPTMFTAARPIAPSSTSRQLSSIRVENVVYAPRKPIMSGARDAAGRT